MSDLRALHARHLAIAVIAMAIVVVSSNVLVQFPVPGKVGPVALADFLTYGAFTYPIAFLVTDLTNRKFGPASARKVVYVGFACALLLSIWLATPRLAVASGSAFLVAQLLDVTVFNRLRRSASWWKAPIVSTCLGSVMDTVVFFSVAFSPVFSALLGMHDGFAAQQAPLLGAFQPEIPRWISWALGDFSVKMLVSLTLLAPYRIMMFFLMPMVRQETSA